MQLICLLNNHSKQNLDNLDVLSDIGVLNQSFSSPSPLV